MLQLDLIESHQGKFPPPFANEKKALHSGKLGDIIYALPTCRKLGISHLIINSYHSDQDPLRTMPIQSAKQLVPLLLEQPYLSRVSLTRNDVEFEHYWNELEGIDYNFDAYRNIARHRVGYILPHLEESIYKYSPDKKPVHLGQMFSAAQGVHIDLSRPWLHAPASSSTKGAVVVSITHNWRSYPDWYWKILVEGLDPLFFVGTQDEYNKAGLKGATYLSCENHLELASHIAGAKLFLGTISFPYSIAEGLKVDRAVEICERNLNAFPTSPEGRVLPPDPIEGREWLSHFLKLKPSDPYLKKTNSIAANPLIKAKRQFWKVKRKLA